ncbi:MBL fold metallo-hydrolase [Tropicimonas sp. IMCC34043]|uniref:MBL fold metallo-hydrolase n=1 Tax=Tropicimonas sp. IMCC34043 TaxID=2248760 RepID=UPI000E23C979|nr:MBL fold metallo-hydrolase [Tropicimonas sp. IMCC34043]
MSAIPQADPIRHPFPVPPAEAAAIEVAPGILWLRLPLPMKLDHVNIFVLDDGDGWTLVDTGFSSTRSRDLWERILGAGPLRGKPVRRVIVTHYHPDHIGLAGWFVERHGVELVTTRTSWLYARMLVLDEQEATAPAAMTFYRGAGMPADLLEKRRVERPVNFADMVWPLPLGFTRIVEGSVVTAGGRSWDVRIGHGHAPEHATLWCREEPLVLGGDQLLGSISPNLGVYPTEPDADPVGEWLESCAALAPFARDDQLVLPGHKLPYYGLPVRLQQLADGQRAALDRLMAFLAQPRTADDCFSPLFRRRIGGGEYGLALAESVGHLNHLYRNGRITRSPGPAGAWLWQVADAGCSQRP